MGSFAARIGGVSALVLGRLLGVFVGLLFGALEGCLLGSKSRGFGAPFTTSGLPPLKIGLWYTSGLPPLKIGAKTPQKRTPTEGTPRALRISPKPAQIGACNYPVKRLLDPPGQDLG